MAHSSQVRRMEITRSGVAEARLDQSPPASLAVLRRSALRRELCQFGRYGWSASPRGVLGCALERVGNLRVGALRSEREMSGPLLWVGDDLCQPGVELPTALRPDARDDCRREQWMCEANAIAVQLDHAVGDSVVERAFL
jgi:hypothetical protein